MKSILRRSLFSLACIPLSCAVYAASFTADVVVVGAGAAGMSAALAAKQAGAQKVVLLEKEAVVGGSTYRAEEGIAAAGTAFQKKAGIQDSAAQFWGDLQKVPGNDRHAELVQTLAEKSSDAVAWLASLNADLSAVSSSSVSPTARLHHPKGKPVGPELVRVLYNAVMAQKIDLRLQTQAVSLIKDASGKISGIRIKDLYRKTESEIATPAVVLATGGFGANLDWVVQVRPELKDYASATAHGTNGDGLTMAEQVGAASDDLARVDVHPTAVPSKGILISQDVIDTGAILLNKQGQRFINEEDQPTVVARAIQAQEDNKATLFFDEYVREQCKRIEDYVHTPNTVAIAPDLKSLAGKMEIPAGKLEEEIALYSAAAKSGVDAQFHRPTMKSTLEKQPNFYGISVKPGIVVTGGGLTINAQAQVLTKTNQPIEGLFAAGEITDNVHGQFLDGIDLADAVIFGRIAGENAARLSQK